MDKSEAKKEVINIIADKYHKNEDLFPMDNIGINFTNSTEYFGQFCSFFNEQESRVKYRINIPEYVLNGYIECDDGKVLMKYIVGHELAHAALSHDIAHKDHHESSEFKRIAKNLSGAKYGNLADNRKVRRLDAYRYVCREMAGEKWYSLYCGECRNKGRAYISGTESSIVSKQIATSLHYKCKCGNKLKSIENKSALKPWTWYGNNIIYSEPKQEISSINWVMFVLLNFIELLTMCYNCNEIVQKEIKEGS